MMSENDDHSASISTKHRSIYNNNTITDQQRFEVLPEVSEQDGGGLVGEVGKVVSGSFTAQSSH